jgi:DNA-binding NarL/FixJ family response regulator
VASKIKVAVVDCYPMFRQGVVETIKRADSFVVVAEGATAEDAVNIVRDRKPDVILLDINIPGDGIEAALKICESPGHAKIVVLTASDDILHVSTALKAGVDGYLLKGVSGRELVTAISNVYQGQQFITPELAFRLLSDTPVGPSADPKLNLSYREQQVLNHVTRGLTNTEIATELSLDVRTIKYHLTRLFKKMGVRNRLEAVCAAKRQNNTP